MNGVILAYVVHVFFCFFRGGLTEWKSEAVEKTTVIIRDHPLINCSGSDDTGTRSYLCPSGPRCSAIVL